MSASALVLVCALDLLGRSADRFPPIRIVPAPPAAASTNAQGYFDRDDGVIYLVASAPAFREAEAAQRRPARVTPCPAREALKIVASVIVHEEWHARYGGDERGAYLAQLTELSRLGAGPGSWPHHSVSRAMIAVLTAKAAEARRLQAVRQTERADRATPELRADATFPRIEDRIARNMVEAR